ncbi:MAG: hypothetical protein JW839_11075, partial [Candidatus Lokiarchaeota archaeon]|nr:hypothetical protein [Candidatus Lokiarchaeota archaeon]
MTTKNPSSSDGIDVKKLLEILPKLIRENDTVKGAIITALSGVVATREDFKDFIRETDKRFDAMQAQMDKRFDAMQTQMNKRFEQVDERLDQVDKRLDQVDKRLDQVDKRLDQ